MSELGVDLRMPAGLLDDPVHGRQAQAGALTGRFGGEERVERALRRLGRHARTGVAHAQAHM